MELPYKLITFEWTHQKLGALRYSHQVEFYSFSKYASRDIDCILGHILYGVAIYM
jgi:hypothetical protein